MRAFSARLLLAGGLALLGAGCTNYRLGTGAEPAFASVYIPPVSNPATVPQAVALVTREVRLAFLRDGRVRLADSAADADAILEITLQGYE